MGQVPHYLIIGCGRLATHMVHYFKLLTLPCTQWHRKQGEAALIVAFNMATHILLLINDNAIADFVAEHPYLTKKTVLHCSGSLVLPNIPSAHPLMTFGLELGTLNWYQCIPFITEKGEPGLPDLLPGLSNMHYVLPKEQKTLYHALCVLSGNFTTLLWQKFEKVCNERLALPSEIVKPYLQQICQNLLSNSVTALTGPLLRDDTQTIDANLAALTGDPFYEVYQAFVNAYHKENARECLNYPS